MIFYLLHFFSCPISNFIAIQHIAFIIHIRSSRSSKYFAIRSSNSSNFYSFNSRSCAFSLITPANTNSNRACRSF